MALRLILLAHACRLRHAGAAENSQFQHSPGWSTTTHPAPSRALVPRRCFGSSRPGARSPPLIWRKGQSDSPLSKSGPIELAFSQPAGREQLKTGKKAARRLGRNRIALEELQAGSKVRVQYYPLLSQLLEVVVD